MTINEIQSTLDQLKARHNPLNEGLVYTLLLAGGWDDPSIKEAIMLFNGRQNNVALPHQDNISFLELPKLSLPEARKEDEELVEETLPEKESLVASIAANLFTKKVKIKETPPEDLPIKPFDSLPNVWSFSRYKDIFYGNEKEEYEEKQDSPVGEVGVGGKEKERNIEAPLPEKKVEQKIVKITEVSLDKVPTTKKDEGIIAVIGMLLLVVTVLIIYMYLNHRL